jgi:hypothetical protein
VVEFGEQASKAIDTSPRQLNPLDLRVPSEEFRELWCTLFAEPHESSGAVGNRFDNSPTCKNSVDEIIWLRGLDRDYPRAGLRPRLCRLRARDVAMLAGPLWSNHKET